MPQFIYETHLHTAESSACASTFGAEYIAPYKKAGFAGIFVTDHFFNGNSAVPQNLAWDEKIERFVAGYKNAKAMAQKLNTQDGTAGTDNEFRVFFGFEYNFKGDEYLVYGLDEAWLKKNPNVLEMNHLELFNAVQEQDALIVQAHPFRFRSYQHAIHVHARTVHAIEAHNNGNQKTENMMAMQFANLHNLITTAGSDMHNANGIFNLDASVASSGVAFAAPLIDEKDFARRIKANEHRIFTT